MSHLVQIFRSQAQVTTIGALQRNVPHSTTSVPFFAPAGATEMVNFSTGELVVSTAKRCVPRLSFSLYSVPHCPNCLFTMRSACPSFRGTVHNVYVPAGRCRPGEGDRRRCRELRRRIGAGAPHLIEGNDVAEQHASAGERPPVIDRDCGCADRRARGVAHAELLRAPSGSLQRREPLADRRDVGKLLRRRESTHAHLVRRSRAVVREHVMERIERRVTVAREPIVVDLGLARREHVHDARMQREPVELAIDVILTQGHAVSGSGSLPHRGTEVQVREAVHHVVDAAWSARRPSQTRIAWCPWNRA